MYRLIVRVLTCVFLFPIALAAYGQTARFSGQVTDPQNAAIANAEVQVENLDTATRTNARTDGSGFYAVSYLPAGHYRVEVRAQGFAVVVSDNLVLVAGEAHILNVQLGIASAQSTVNVNAGSEVTEVNTRNAEISGTVTGKEVAGLQLNGRNFTQLIALVPGVSNQTQQDEARVGVLGSVSYSVNGGRTEYNSFQVDGAETLNVGINKDHTALLVTPSIDAIQEVKVLTSNYGAQYPSTGNGTTIVTTKSGTDEYHGNLYEFVRNEMFNAKGYFDVTNGAPLYRRNDFGGTIGGPLSIPHLYDARGRTHFFFSEEMRLEKDPYAYRQAVPSLAERNGDFSDVCAIYAVGGQTQANTQDCPSVGGVSYAGTQELRNLTPNLGSVSPYATAILGTGILPAPNAYTGCNGGPNPIGSCYLADVSLPTYFREELFRIDQTVNQRTVASFRYIHDEWDATTPIPQFSSITNSFPTIQNRFYGPGLSLVARASTTFSQTLLNEFIVGYTDSYSTLKDKAGEHVSLARPLLLDDAPCSDGAAGCGMGSLFANDFGGKMPGIVFGGNNAAYGGYGFSMDTGYEPWKHTNPIYSLADNMAKTIGHHNLTFGAQWVIFQRNQINGPSGASSGNVQGLLTFSNEQSINTTGNAFADFLIASGAGGTDFVTSGGLPASYEQDSTQQHYYQRYQIAEPYIQDDWKVNSRLTINAGVRLSLFGTYHEKNHNAYNWLPGSFDLSLARSVRVSNSGELVSSGSGSQIGYDGFAYHLPNGAVIRPTSPGYINMEAACYGYGGNSGGGTVDPATLREYAPGIGQIYSLQNVANSAYNGFQLSVRHVSEPLTVGVAYTYSHSIDNASDRSDATFVNSFDLKSNRASSAFDERHLLHISYLYNLPVRAFLQHMLGNLNSNPDPDAHAVNRSSASFLTSRMYGVLLDHWQLSGITVFESGIPFTVVNGGSGTGPSGVSVLDNAGVYNGLGSGSYPDRVAGISVHGHRQAAGNNGSSVGPLLLNPAAFTAPQGLTFGNAGRNSMNNPHRLNFDMATQKNFAVTERVHLEFRAEAFNIFNATQFRIYDPTLGNQPENTVSCYSGSATTGYSAAGDANTDCLTGSSFLHPVDAHRPRTIQFGMKLAF